jgi:hypothetical protein
MRRSCENCLILSLAALLVSLAATPAALSRDPAADAKVLQAAHVPTDAEGLLDFLRQQIPSDADRASLDKLIKCFGSGSFVVREKACAEAVALGSKAVYRLRQALADPDPEVHTRAESCLQAIERRSSAAVDLAVIRSLKDKAPPSALGLLLNYLPFAADDAASSEALAALTTAATQGQVSHPELTAALRDRLPERRAAAAFVLGRVENRRREVRPLLSDPDPEVRVRCAQGLLAGGDASVVPVVISWLIQGPPALAERAEDVLAWLAGVDTPVAPAPEDDASRRKCHDLWVEWWKENGANFRITATDPELLVDLQGLRARRATQQFVNALAQGDDAVATAMMGTPFLYKFGRRSVVEFGQVTRRLRAYYRGLHNADGAPKIARIVDGADYAAKAEPSERDFLRSFPLRRLRVVTVSLGERGRVQERVFFVYLAEGRTRIVGFGYG